MKNLKIIILMLSAVAVGVVLKSKIKTPKGTEFYLKESDKYLKRINDVH